MEPARRFAAPPWALRCGGAPLAAAFHIFLGTGCEHGSEFPSPCVGVRRSARWFCCSPWLLQLPGRSAACSPSARPRLVRATTPSTATAGGPAPRSAARACRRAAQRCACGAPPACDARPAGTDLPRTAGARAQQVRHDGGAPMHGPRRCRLRRRVRAPELPHESEGGGLHGGAIPTAAAVRRGVLGAFAARRCRPAPRHAHSTRRLRLVGGVTGPSGAHRPPRTRERAPHARMRAAGLRRQCEAGFLRHLQWQQQGPRLRRRLLLQPGGGLLRPVRRHRPHRRLRRARPPRPRP